MRKNINTTIAEALKEVWIDMIADLVSDISYERDGIYYCKHKTKGEITSVEMAKLLFNHK